MDWNKNKYLDIIKETQTIKEIGKITEIIGLTIESDGPKSSIGVYVIFITIIMIHLQWQRS